MGFAFPTSPVFTGFNEPRRIQAEVDDLLIDGEVPRELAGALYRNGPDPRFPPLLGDDVNWNGDGMVTMWRFQDGHIDFRCRYVRTEKFELERAARRALFGAYRNPFTDDPAVRGRDRTTANTSVYMHAGALLAVKEDGLPYRIDPVTLETLRRHDYGGAIRSLTTTAHPKVDPVSGDLFALGYEATGPASLDISLQHVAADGSLASEQFLQLPHVAFIHDWGVTAEHLIIPAMPTTTSTAILEARQSFRWVHDPSRETKFGILKRGAPVESIRWFRGPPSGGGGHFLNAYTEGDKVILDGFHSRNAQFPYVPNMDGTPFDRDASSPHLARWTFDLASNTDEFHVEELFPDDFMEMPVVDPRYAMRRHTAGFTVVLDRSKPSIVQGTLGLGWNTLVKVDVERRTSERWYVGDNTTCQEPVFVPRSAGAAEADGWLLSVLTRDTGAGVTSELAILDTADLAAGPVAIVRMPFRLHGQVHGSWVSAAELERAGSAL
ncbi:MAG: carotenoid oxygenase family protein [Caulobacteraceae bacterium]